MLRLMRCANASSGAAFARTSSKGSALKGSSCWHRCGGNPAFLWNYALLAELGRIGRPVLLKRGLAAPISEFLMAAVQPTPVTSAASVMPPTEIAL